MQAAQSSFTVTAYQRRAVLIRPEVRSALREAITMVRQKMPFEIDAWNLLPDHLHAIWTMPENDTAFGRRWGLIKSHVSTKCGNISTITGPRRQSRIRRHENDFWQRRFWEHQMRDDLDYEHHMDYIHYNPVKHRLAHRVSEWPYSTFHRYAGIGIYPEDCTIDPGEVVGDAGE